MDSPPLLRTLVAVFVPYVFATLASARVFDRGVGPVLVGVATTAIVLTVVRAFDGGREPVALLDAE